MKRITGRFVLLIATAAVLPLLVYGWVSVRNLNRGTEQSVSLGNQAVARQIAAQIKLYFDNSHRVLASIGTQIRSTQLDQWQQEQILRNHVLDFPEFREISVFDDRGRQRASSRVGASTLTIPSVVETENGGRIAYYVAKPTIDTDALPTTTMAIPLEAGGESEESGWIIAEISLEELWRTVDRIKVGTSGYALLLDEDGNLVAHGNPNDKPLIAKGAQAAPDELDLAKAARNAFDEQKSRTCGAELDRHQTPEIRQLSARKNCSPSARPSTTLAGRSSSSSRPTMRFACRSSSERSALRVISLALLGTVILGWVWGRSFIQRIFALTRVTRAIAEGRMDERVVLSGQDEIRQLGDAFNSMADRLVELQEEIRKQERQAMFGRIAAGLVHDLSHPIQNIGNSCKLIQKMFEDAEYRETFKKTVERELVIIKRVLDDLRNIARPIPLERFPVDLNRTVADAAEAMEQHAETAGLTLRTELTPENVFIEGDVFALGRVYRNLILNAIQATAPGGLIVVASEAHGDRAQVRIYDTGCGIPPDRLGQIFEDFVTTKRRGLGLGLAISKKIVEQLGGTISVASEVGKGTTFVLEFPRTAARPMLVAG